MLSQAEKGGVQNTIQNCVTVLQNDPVLADSIRLNLLSERIDIVKPMGWQRSGPTLTDTDMMYILRRMEKYGLYSEKRVSAAIRIVANENHYHPIRDYLNDLKWDGTERIMLPFRPARCAGSPPAAGVPTGQVVPSGYFPARPWLRSALPALRWCPVQ